MPRPRAPWWMYVAVLSFLGYVALFLYQFWLGPQQLVGADWEFVNGALVMTSVEPGSFAAGTGLRTGDRVLAVDGQPIRNDQDWQTLHANRVPENPEKWEITRDGRQIELLITFPRGFWRGLRGADLVGTIEYIIFTLISFAVGLFIAFGKPYDHLARVGAWLIATAAIAGGAADGWAARPWVVIWLPVLAGLPWRLEAAYGVVYAPQHASAVPAWALSAILFRTPLYLAAGAVALVVNYRRLEDLNERRRVRVLVIGTALALGAALDPFQWLRGWSVYWSSTLDTVFSLLLFAFPLSFGYAILRHRLFDISVMIRQGLRYGVARGALLSVVPVLGAALGADLFLHGNEPLVAILRARGWVYVSLGGLAWLAHAKRRQWLEGLDRRFFRERYDAQRLLREVAEEVRQAGSFERAALLVVAHVETALHPEFVALLTRRERDADFTAAASAPPGQAPPKLPAASKLIALVRVLGKPLEISLTEAGWLRQQLPHSETDFLRQARIDLIVPVATAPERVEVLLVLGAKRSEEPYTREDQDLLAAIAGSLALLLERPATTDAARALPEGATSGATSPAPSPAGSADLAEAAFEECPKCGTCYDTGSRRCAQDGVNLLATHLQRVLAGRYRLERRRGRGGMGAVYEATDTALERRVAVKVIRDDLVGSAEAAERFRREAKASASFTHPNVVTVYDFGVAADTRAFLVMELLEGETLREELQTQKRLAGPRVVEIFRGVCAAVDAGHRRQLVHRDLKPENVFLARSEASEIVKVLDFGIAKFLPEATQATSDTAVGTLVGTLNYMSENQLRDGTVDRAWDLWALSVIAYEALTGVLPFAGANAGEVQARVLGGRFTPIATHLPEAPATWQEFFTRMFSLERNKRPASALIFFSELEQALA